MTNGLLGAAMRCLGEPVVYSAQGYSAVTIQGVFDEISQEIDAATGAVVASVRPTLGVKNIDLPATPRANDTIVVRSQQYRVVDVHPDGLGGSKLDLHKA